jgi:hypothetical protein
VKVAGGDGSGTGEGGEEMPGDVGGGVDGATSLVGSSDVGGGVAGSGVDQRMSVGSWIGCSVGRSFSLGVGVTVAAEGAGKGVCVIGGIVVGSSVAATGGSVGVFVKVWGAGVSVKVGGWVGTIVSVGGSVTVVSTNGASWRRSPAARTAG